MLSTYIAVHIHLDRFTPFQYCQFCFSIHPINSFHLRAVRCRIIIGLLSYRLVVVFFVSVMITTFVITTHITFVSLRAVHLQIHHNLTIAGRPKCVVDVSTWAWRPCGVSFSRGRAMLPWHELGILVPIWYPKERDIICNPYLISPDDKTVARCAQSHGDGLFIYWLPLCW